MREGDGEDTADIQEELARLTVGPLLQEVLRMEGGGEKKKKEVTISKSTAARGTGTAVMRRKGATGR